MPTALLWTFLTAMGMALVPLQGDADTVNPYAAFRNQVVHFVQFQAPPGTDLRELHDLVDIQPGYLLAAADVQTAMQRLFALGRFSQIEVFAEPQPASPSIATGLIFVLTPLSRLDEITIKGCKHTDVDALNAALTLQPGDEVDGRTANTLQARALTYLQRSGYARADVQMARYDTPDGGLVRFDLSVREGLPRRIHALAFSGTPRLPKQVLEDMLQSRVGAPLNLNTLRQDSEDLLCSYRERGFLLAHLEQPSVARASVLAQGEDGPSTWYDVTFNLTAGRRYTIDFIGNTVFDEVALRHLLAQDAGLSLSANLRLLRQNIVAQYIRQGYPDAKIRLRQVDDEAHMSRLVFHIQEGRPLVVERIVFSGNTALPSSLLRKQVTTLLHRELAQDEAFTPLARFERRLQMSNSYRPLPSPPAFVVPPQQRWVAEVFAEATAQIAAAYRDAGYLNVAIATPHLALLPADGCGYAAVAQKAEISIAVEEGSQTLVSAISIAGNTAMEAADILQIVSDATSGKSLSAALTPGAPLSQNGVEDGRIEIVRRYRNQGYRYARVFARVDNEPGARWAQVRYLIEEGPQVRIARVLIRGHGHTREGVIRSRLSMAAGDWYRLEQAVADQRSISSLGVFSGVKVKLVDEEREEERKDVVAEVSERMRQPIDVAPGLSTAHGPRLRASYSHLNVWGTASTFTATVKVNRKIFFDLFGDFADGLRARYASYVGSQQLTRALEREIRFGLRSPPVSALPFDPIFRADLVDQRINAVRYALDREAFIMGADLRMPAHFRGALESQIGLINLECDEKIDPNCNLTPEVRRFRSRPIDVGRLWILASGPSLTWDRRDNPLNPSRGLFASLKATYALGAATPRNHNGFEPFTFAKYEANVTGYIPLWGPVLALAARGGNISLLRSQVPIDQRFFLGGRDTVRSFVESTLIPEDACVGVGEKPASCAEQLSPSDFGPPLSRGGNAYLLLKSELRFPVTETISLGVFADMGNLWIRADHINPLQLRLGTGVGFRYATPVGAIAIDFGLNPYPRLYQNEAHTQFHFSIGAF